MVEICFKERVFIAFVHFFTFLFFLLISFGFKIFKEVISQCNDKVTVKSYVPVYYFDQITFLMFNGLDVLCNRILIQNDVFK